MILHKYPRTLHLPWSKGIGSDDKVLNDLSSFAGKDIIVLEKLDGECTSMYPHRIHARSVDSAHNFTRDWVKRLHSYIKADLEENEILCGENVWAEHSIRYPDGYLKGYFYLFNVFEGDTCIQWSDVEFLAEMLDLPVPRIFYRGPFNTVVLQDIAQALDPKVCEGYVVRLTESFHRNAFSKSVAKYVREGHVQTDEHWLKNAKQNGSLDKDTLPYYMSPENISCY